MRKNLTVEDLGNLVDLPLVAVLATYRANGSVLLSPVWHEWRDGGFNVITSQDDVKARHLRRAGERIAVPSRADEGTDEAARARKSEADQRVSLGV